MSKTLAANTNLSLMAASTIKVNLSGSSAYPQDVSIADFARVANLASGTNFIAGQSNLTYTVGVTADGNYTIGLSSSNTNIVYVPGTITTPGYEINIIQLGTGTTTISAINGAVIRQPYNQYRLAQQYSAASLVYFNSTVGWVLYGDLKT